MNDQTLTKLEYIIQTRKGRIRIEINQINVIQKSKTNILLKTQCFLKENINGDDDINRCYQVNISTPTEEFKWWQKPYE